MPVNDDLISRSALIKATAGISEDTTCPMHIAAEYLQYMTEAPAVVVLKWISVKDKLPERNKRVLVAFKGGMVTTSMRTLEQHTGAFGFLFEGDYGTATHWMPMPEPPKEG